MGSSASVAQNNIAEIVQLIDIPSNTPLILQDVLLALQCVFALIPGPLGVFAANSWKFDNTWQSLAQILSNALNAAPNVGRYLFPADNAASQLIQIGELSHNFANVIMQVQSNLNQTVSSVMANSTEFLAFASQGNFTAKPPSLPDQVNYLYYGFNTYLISQALNGNNVYGVIGVDTDPRQLATNGTKTPYSIDCQEYDETNVCDAWWYSENFGSAFTLDDFSHMDRNYNSQLSTLLGNYTTGQLLFEGAYTCHSEGNFGKPINITINAGGINTACISQLKVLTWNMACTSVRDHSCEFLEGLSQNTFYGSNPSFDVNSQQIFSVPAGYLGPLVAQSDVQLRRN